MAPFGAHVCLCFCPQATLTFGQCALRLIQVKAVGLVEVSDLVPQQLSAEPLKGHPRALASPCEQAA